MTISGLFKLEEGFAVADPRGRQGCAPSRSKFFIFMQFCAKILQKKIGWRTTVGSQQPSSGKSWIRHWFAHLCLQCSLEIGRSSVFRVRITVSGRSRIPQTSGVVENEGEGEAPSF